MSQFGRRICGGMHGRTLGRRHDEDCNVAFDTSTASPDTLLSVSDAARELRYSITYIRRLADTGALPCVRVTHGHFRLFRLRDVQAFRRSHVRRRYRRKSNKPQLPAT